MPCTPGVSAISPTTVSVVDVNHHDLGGVADIEPAGVLVHRQVIPAAFAADGDFLEQLIRLSARLLGTASSGEQAECGQSRETD